MGAHSGSMTFRQYYVRHPLPADWRERFHEGIERMIIRPLDPAGEEERALGWCGPHFALDVELNSEQYLYNDYLILGLRIDTLTVPGALLRLFAEAEARRVMAEQKRATLTRYERAEIKDRVKAELKKKVLPSIKAIDLVWNLQDGVVRFYSTNEKLNVEFAELFEQTFELPLTSDAAYVAGLLEAVGLTDAERAALDGVEPTPFVDLETAVAAMKE